MTSSRPLLAASALTFLSIASAPERALAGTLKCDDATAVAKAVAAANSAFAAERFADAADGYADAYACNHDASLLFNLSKADLKLGRYVEGLDAIQRFQAASKDLPKEVLSAASDVASELSTHVGTITVRSAAPGARVSIGDKELGPAPVENAEVVAGALTIRVTAPGHDPEVRNIDVKGGGHADVDVTFGSASPTPAPEPEKPGTKKVFHVSPLVWAGAATAGVGLVVALGTGIESAVETSDIKKQCHGKDGNQCPASTEDARSKANALANASNAFIGVAAAGAVLGVVGIVLSGKRDEPVATSLVVTPTGLRFEGTF